MTTYSESEPKTRCDKDEDFVHSILDSISLCRTIGDRFFVLRGEATIEALSRTDATDLYESPAAYKVLEFDETFEDSN